MNADETQGIWGLATFIKNLMEDAEDNLELMHKNIRFKVIPIINASGFDEATLRYAYSDGVNPNFNFNYKNSWANQTGSNKGDYPDSNISTQYLKKWINDNCYADLWLDLHTGRWVVAGGTDKTILDIRTSNAAMANVFNATYIDLVKAYYQAKGYIVSTDSIGNAASIETNLDYQKTVYAYQVNGIKSIMPEMHIESTGYGADGYTNNTVNGIKCYVGLIRIMIMCFINDSVVNYSLKLDSSPYARLHQRY